VADHVERGEEPRQVDDSYHEARHGACADSDRQPRQPVVQEERYAHAERYRHHRDIRDGQDARLAERTGERRPVEADLVECRAHAEDLEQGHRQGPVAAKDQVHRRLGEEQHADAHREAPQERESIRLGERLEQEVAPVLDGGDGGVQRMRHDVVDLFRVLRHLRGERQRADGRGAEGAGRDDERHLPREHAAGAADEQRP
jgi:hypothetical protein